MENNENITNSGSNLSVLIDTETGQDWQTFATWYSIFKNIPNAKVAITCARNTETPFQYFQWAKRLKIPTIHYEHLDLENRFVSRIDAVGKAISRKMVGKSILVVKPLIMFVDILDQKLVDQFNFNNEIFDNDVWFLKSPNISDMLNDYMLYEKPIEIQEKSIYCQAKESEDISPIVSYHKGCGKWIHTLKGCPFSNAGHLISDDMTSNENRIIELWKKMCPLYNTVI